MAAPDHFLAKIFKTGQNQVFSIRVFKSPEKTGFLDIWVGGVWHAIVPKNAKIGPEVNFE